jgi:UDP-glucose 4-epimerase
MNLSDADRCLVTGGAGFIGSHLVDRLLKEKVRVRVLDNLSTGRWDHIAPHRDDPLLEFTYGSIVDSSDARRAVSGVDVVFHLACLGVRHSLSQPHENHRVNAEGSLVLLEAARREGVQRYVHCSTSEVYGTAQWVPMTEDHPTLPRTVYGASKLAAEAYARAYHTTYGLPIVIVRPFNTFGPRSHHEGDAGEMIPKSIVRALGGKDIRVFGSGRQTRDFTYVADTVEGLVRSAEQDALVGNTYNIGSGSEISIRRLAEMLIGRIGNPETEIHHTAARPGDVDRLYADASAFSDATGWTPHVNFGKGLDATIAFFKNHRSGIAALLEEEKVQNWKGKPK